MRTEAWEPGSKRDARVFSSTDLGRAALAKQAAAAAIEFVLNFADLDRARWSTFQHSMLYH